jgi:hypothetical protein
LRRIEHPEVSQDAAQPHFPRIIERDDAIVDEIGRSNGRLAVIELGEGDLCVSVDESLLVDASGPLYVADVEPYAERAIAPGIRFRTRQGLPFALGLLQRGDLAVGQNQALPGDLGFERLEPLPNCLKIMTVRDPANASRRYRIAELAKLVDDADPAIRSSSSARERLPIAAVNAADGLRRYNFLRAFLGGNSVPRRRLPGEAEGDRAGHEARH